MPDETAETFLPATGHGGIDGADGRGARYLGWSWDPDPGDTWTQTDYAFLLRGADGHLQAVYETHRTGLFARAAWVRLLADAGFEVTALTEETDDVRAPRELFVGHR